jgi:hypothetical protein
MLEYNTKLKKSSKQPNPAAKIKQLAITSENPNFN